MTAVHYDSYTEARNNLKHLLDAAEHRQVATVRRDATLIAVLDAVLLRNLLATTVPSGAQVVQEGDGWSVFIPGLPVAADAGSLDEAIGEMIQALREYSEDWQDHLRNSPNHRENWGLVQLIDLSDDDQLRRWLMGEAE
jgi:predicted RNase H-like HicB family nuclease